MPPRSETTSGHREDLAAVTADFKRGDHVGRGQAIANHQQPVLGPDRCQRIRLRGIAYIARMPLHGGGQASRD